MNKYYLYNKEISRHLSWFKVICPNNFFQIYPVFAFIIFAYSIYFTYNDCNCAKQEANFLFLNYPYQIIYLRVIFLPPRWRNILYHVGTNFIGSMLYSIFRSLKNTIRLISVRTLVQYKIYLRCKI